MHRYARSLILVNDLRRSFWGWMLAHLVTRLVTRSDVVHQDGPQSVRAAFSIKEASEFARQVGISDLNVERRWPFRFLLSGKSADAGRTSGVGSKPIDEV